MEQERQPDTRARILQSAMKVFSEKGFHGASVRGIALEAELSVGGIYTHFAGKEEILKELLKQRSLAPLFTLFDEMAGSEDFEKDLEQITVRFLERLEEYQDFFTLLFVDFLEFEGRHSRELIAEVIYPVMVKRLGHLAQMVNGGKIREINPYVLARAFGALFIGYHVTQKMVFRDLDLVSQKELVKGLLNIFLHGILPA